jgi:hypothetical protein
MMNKLFLGVALLLVAQSALAISSVRFGNRLVATGDGAGKVIQVAGKPDRTVQLENEYSANVGERWEYYQARKTVLIIFKNGEVSDIQEVYN